jgi:8-oxo-dGTP pyrophosphatase MutT (NUDIX family)
MSDYIMEIRKQVGNIPLILAGSAVLVFDKQERLLVQKRTDNEMWGLPGGFTERGESLEETAIREVYEETGLKINNLSFFKVFSGKSFFYEYPNGDQVYFITAVYHTDLYSGTLNSNNIESIDLQFKHPEEVLTIKNFDENDRKVLKEFLGR